MQVEDLDDEEERDFYLIEHDEPKKLYTQTIDLDTRYEETIKDIIIQEKEAHVQALVENLERAKYVSHICNKRTRS